MIGARSPGAPVRPLSPLPVGLAAAGAAATALALVAPLGPPLGEALRLPPPARILLAASAVSLAVTMLLAPHRFGRGELLVTGLAALGAQALLMAMADPLAVAALLLLVAFCCATRPGNLPLAVRVRGPALAAALLGVGWTFVRTPGADWLGRVGALALALGLVAAAGLLPYLPEMDRKEPASSSYLAWTAFFGPALALSLPGRLLPAFNAGEALVFGATLIGLGLVNLGWGTLGAWRAPSGVDAWRYSFLADWGLALVGIGLFLPDGFGAAYLALLSIVLVRLPLHVWARPVLLGREQPSLGPVNVLLAVLLAGAAPFSGFPVRVLVLHAATQVAWPLAVPLLAAMVAGIAPAFRLASTIGAPRGRTAAGLWLTLALSLALGLAPGALRAVGAA